MVIVAGIYFIPMPHRLGGSNLWFNYILGHGAAGAYSFFILQVEKKEFRKLPVVGNIFSPLQTVIRLLKTHRSRLPVTGPDNRFTRKHVQPCTDAVFERGKILPGKVVRPTLCRNNTSPPITKCCAAQ